MFYVYHIVKSSDVNDIDVGYIGVTNNFERRKSQHFNALVEGKHLNYKLQEYYDQHTSGIMMYIFKEFEVEENAYKFEAVLRPHANVGLNIASGGDKEYHKRFEAKKFQNEYKPKGFFANVRSLVKALDHDLSDWADQSIVQAKKKEKRNKIELEEQANARKAVLDKRKSDLDKVLSKLNIDDKLPSTKLENVGGAGFFRFNEEILVGEVVWEDNHKVVRLTQGDHAGHYVQMPHWICANFELGQHIRFFAYWSNTEQRYCINEKSDNGHIWQCEKNGTIIHSEENKKKLEELREKVNRRKLE